MSIISFFGSAPVESNCTLSIKRRACCAIISEDAILTQIDNSAPVQDGNQQLQKLKQEIA